jgi:hypothetical protein
VLRKHYCQRQIAIMPLLLCLQFGPASGSLGALSDQSFMVVEKLVDELRFHLKAAKSIA